MRDASEKTKCTTKILPSVGFKVKFSDKIPPSCSIFIYRVEEFNKFIFTSSLNSISMRPRLSIDFIEANTLPSVWFFFSSIRGLNRYSVSFFNDG